MTDNRILREVRSPLLLDEECTVYGSIDPEDEQIEDGIKTQALEADSVRHGYESASIWERAELGTEEAPQGQGMRQRPSKPS